MTTMVPPRRQRARSLWIVAALLMLCPLSCVPAVVVVAWVADTTSTVDTLAFANPLRIPPLARPELAADGTKVFTLRAQAGSTDLLPGAPTATWGIDGSHLGPTLRAARGDRVQVRLRNDLPEPTTVHWHGMALPAEADGGPHQLVASGATWSPSWTIDQPAATLWYHPHPHGATADQVGKGVAGLFLVDDERSAHAGLPHEYGVDDVPVILQDRSFDGDNQFASGLGAGAGSILSPYGALGDTILVNGTHDPHLDVTTDRVRLRVLNASNGRIYRLQFADGRPFTLVGTDGGLTEEPPSLTSLLLSPGERAELLVSLTGGERVVLRSEAPGLGLDGIEARLAGAQDRFDLLELRAAPALTRSDAPDAAARPADQVPDRVPDVASVDRTRTIELGDSKIDGRRMDMDRIDQEVVAGATELWTVQNRHSIPHSLHLHLVQFRVVDVDGRPPPPELSGWKDTVLVVQHSTVRLVARFTGSGVRSPSDGGTYVYHCHILRHEDDGMMGQFRVSGPA